MKKIIIGLFLLSISFLSFSHSLDFIQGPFKIDENKSIYFKQEDNKDYPVSLYFDMNGIPSKIDSYETNGAIPHIDTVFFEKLNNIKNIIVLVSWHQQHLAEKINGDLYQVYGYKYIGDKLIANESIIKDPALNGLDGEFNGQELKFKYKNAASIRKYIKEKHIN